MSHTEAALAGGHRELFTQEVRMMREMKVMRRRWDRSDDKMIQRNISGKETAATVVNAEMKSRQIHELDES